MILVGTDEGIFRWFEGAPWLIFHSLQGIPIVGLASPGRGVLAALDASGRVHETEDNGLHWRELPLPAGAGRVTTLAIGGEPSELVLAVRPLGLLSRPVGAPLPRRRSTGPLGFLARRGGGEAVATASMRAAASDDAGWTRMGVPTPEATGFVPEVRVLVRVGTNGPWYAAVSGCGLWKSADGGESWTACPGLPADIYALRPLPGQAGGLAAATSDGGWVSRDGGETWSDSSGGLEQARHVRVVEINPENPKHWLAGAATVAPGAGLAAPAGGLGFGLYESKDGGASWLRVQKGFPTDLQYDTIDDIRWDPAASGNALIALGSGECWRTNTAGMWWEPVARQTRAARVLCALA